MQTQIPLMHAVSFTGLQFSDVVQVPPIAVMRFKLELTLSTMYVWASFISTDSLF